MRASALFDIMETVLHNRFHSNMVTLFQSHCSQNIKKEKQINWCSCHFTNVKDALSPAIKRSHLRADSLASPRARAGPLRLELVQQGRGIFGNTPIVDSPSLQFHILFWFFFAKSDLEWHRPTTLVFLQSYFFGGTWWDLLSSPSESYDLIIRHLR